MKNFIVVAIVRVQHTFYTSGINPDIELYQTPKTEVLMKERGMSFGKVGNEWQWVMPADCAGFAKDDVLEVCLHANDPEFLYKVDVPKDFRTDILYRINLAKEMIVEACAAMEADVAGSKLNTEFCRIRLKPPQSTIEKIRFLLKQPSQDATKQLEEIRECINSMPLSLFPGYTLVLQTPGYIWEYLFVLREDSQLRVDGRKLNLSFSHFSFKGPEKVEDCSFGKHVWRFLSDECIPLRNAYRDTPILKEKQEKGSDRVILRSVPTPKVGKYISDRVDVLRQVCYI